MSSRHDAESFDRYKCTNTFSITVLHSVQDTNTFSTFSVIQRVTFALLRTIKHLTSTKERLQKKQPVCSSFSFLSLDLLNESGTKNITVF
jgi:hypothetical protein